jgi:Domain of unknown function (DUF4962)/Heparinase II/III-like protein
MKLFSAIAIVVLFYNVFCFSQVTKEEMNDAININELHHPYLYFTEKGKPEILDRIKNDPHCQKVMEALLAEGHRFLKMPFKAQDLVEPKHPRYSTDGKAAHYVSEISQGAITCAFLYQMTGDTAYANRGIEFAIALSDLPEWINGAHRFDIIYPRVWPWNVPDDRVVFSFDITAARKTRVLSIAYDWLYPALTKYQRDKIRNGLLEKAITRVRRNYEFFWWSTAYRCNWAAVCYSGLGVTAMTLLNDNPQLIDVVAECYNRLNLVFDQIGEDGGWQEGRGYYGFMLEHSVFFTDALKRLSNGKYNLFTHKRIKDHPFDFGLYGLTASFEDSDGRPIGQSYLVNKFTQETGDNTSAWYNEKFVNQGYNIFDIIWPESSVKPIEPKQKSKLFKGIDWAVMRSDFLDPSTVTIACKAGFNNDPHHGHLDIGQFILTYQNIPFINESRRMQYDELYFNEDRYDYPQASSLGHNVIFVNGEQQIIAKKKNTPWKEGIGGKILDFQTSDKRDYVLMDPTHSYPNKELKKWRRSMILEKPVVTLVLDEVGAAPESKIEARFFPGVGVVGNSQRNFNHQPERSGEYKINDKYVFLSDGRNHNMALIPLVLNNDFKIIKDEVPTIPVTEDARLNWLQYFETVTKSKDDNTIIASIILPVKNESEADSIVNSANIIQKNSDEIEVSLNSKSGNYDWLFKKDKEGYVFENK